MEVFTFSLAEDIISCAICCDRYRDPRLLRCAHQFCLACLQKTVVHYGRLTCPLCRQVTRLASGKTLDSLARPIVMNSAQSYIEQTLTPAKVSPTGCSVCAAGARAVEYCYDCQDKLCAACVSAHRKAMENHRAVAFSSSLFCDAHKEPLLLYCVTCEQATCKRCVITDDHRGHDTENLAERASRYRAKVARHMRRYRADVTAAGDTLAATIAEESAAIARAKSEIDAAVRLLQSTADKLEVARTEIRWRAEANVALMEESGREVAQERQENEDYSKYLLESLADTEVVAKSAAFLGLLKAGRKRSAEGVARHYRVTPRVPDSVRRLLCPPEGEEAEEERKPYSYYSQLVKGELFTFEERKLQEERPLEDAPPPVKRQRDSGAADAAVQSSSGVWHTEDSGGASR